MHTPDPSLPPPQGRQLISWALRPIRGRLVVAAILACAGSILTLVPLAGIASIAQLLLGTSYTDAGLAGAWSEHRAVIRLTLFASLGCLCAGMLLMSLGELVAHLADNYITHQLRQAAAKQLARVPLGWFSSRSSGDIKQALHDDISTLHELTAHYYTTSARAFGAISISVLYLFAMDWRLAIISLLPFPGYHWLFGAAKKSISETRMRELAAGQARINSAVVEFANGIPVVKAFAADGKAHGAYRDAVEGYLTAFLRFTGPLVLPLANANALVAPVTVLGVVLLSGTAFVGMGWVRPVDVLPFALVAPAISAPLLLLSFISHGIAHGIGAAQRIYTLLNTTPLSQPTPELRQLPQGSEIRFEQVSYTYDGEHKVLDDVSITLKTGTVTALVGASGSGKSTLARLLLRYFDPLEGRITLGGADLRHIDSSDLYRHIGFVLQEVRLIHASVRDNIALGRPSATQSEIVSAARAANIHERILALPRGYESVVGEDAQFSGGEAQRVSIARAILLDPQVLVLDKATSAVDAENEAAIQAALSHFTHGRTLLVVAHRLDTIMHADTIVVMDDGKLIECGTHAELLLREGHYARLWRQGGYMVQAQEAAPC